VNGQAARKRKITPIEDTERALLNAAWVAVYWSDSPLPRDYRAWMFDVDV